MILIESHGFFLRAKGVAFTKFKAFKEKEH
jgi:hypothetical protein